jgi:hypothetical protein
MHPGFGYGPGKRTISSSEGFVGIGASIFLIALGAVLAFAVNVSVSGIDLDAIGVILMIVGIVGLIASMLLLNGGGGGWYGGGRRTTVVDDAYVDAEPPVVSRRRIVRRRDVI